METLEQCARRMLLEILLDGDVRYWHRRAQGFAAVGTPDCDVIARACFAKARMVALGDDLDEFAELLDVQLSDLQPGVRS